MQWTENMTADLEAEYKETIQRFDNDPILLLDAVTKEHSRFLKYP